MLLHVFKKNFFSSHTLLTGMAKENHTLKTNQRYPESKGPLHTAETSLASLLIIRSTATKEGILGLTHVFHIPFEFHRARLIGSKT